MLLKSSSNGLHAIVLTWTLLSALILPPCFLQRADAAGTSGLVAKDPSKPRLVTLREALKQGLIAFKLEGDGRTTSSVRLLITNKTDKPLRCVIAANEYFHPNVLSVQNMMATDDRIVDLETGKTTVVELPTICVSAKTIAPPPAGTAGVVYQVAANSDKQQWQGLAAIVAAARDLALRGFYDAVPLGKGTKENQITQLAVWKLLGETSNKPEDKVTPESIEQNLLKELTESIKKDPDQLAKLGEGFKLSPKGELIVSEKRKKGLDQWVDKIYTAVDLTVKRSSDTNLHGICSLPEESPWDTYCSVGERAFSKGDYIEAEELLKTAAHDAEVFGEADPRLARSLNSLGRCYLEMDWTERAEPFLTRSLSIREKLYGANAPEVAEVANNMGQLRQLETQYADAGNFFSKALDIYEKSAGGTSDTVGSTLNHVGRNYNLLKDGVAAEPPLKRALAIALLTNERDQPQFEGKSVAERPAPIESPQVAETETNLATAYSVQAKYPDAEKFYNKALSTDLKALGEDHPYVATILDGLADVCAKQDRAQDAETWKKKAESIREKTLGKENAQVATLPYSSESLTRIKAYLAGSKSIQSNVATLRAAASLLPGASADKTKINRPIKDKWALVIGISKFKDASMNLQYAAKDAKDFAAFLQKEENFQPDHIKLITDEKATKKNILEALGDKWLPRVANPDDLVVIFISSHGSPSDLDQRGTNFLIAHDTDKTSLWTTGIGMDEMTSWIKKRVFSDRVVVLLDACHSGATEAAGKGIFRAQNFDAESIAMGSGQLVVCSSAPAETSWESKRYANGVFTHCLMEALRKNGTKTKLKEAYLTMQDQVQEEVQRDRAVRQTPVLKAKWDGDDIVIGAPPTQIRPGLADEEPTEKPAATKTATTPKSVGSKAPVAAVKPVSKPAGKPNQQAVHPRPY